MSPGAHSIRLHETLLTPPALQPPPLRHALLAALVTAAALLHIGTAGWGEIHNGLEGEHASAAREMLETQQWFVEQPMLHWLLAASFSAFGLTTAAARVPVALAMVGCVALMFLVAERLGGFRRGFLAGAMFLCSIGSFWSGRNVTPEPLFTLFVTAALYCAVAGYQERNRRGRRYLAFWAFVVTAWLTCGIVALVVPLAIVFGAGIGFREGRIRFRPLFRWFYLLLAAALCWQRAMPSIPQLRIDAALPWLLLVLPGSLLAWRKIIRPAELDFTAALPLAWMAVAAITGQNLLFVGGVVLFASTAWERLNPPLQLAGVGLVAAAGVAAVFLLRRNFLPDVPEHAWGALFPLPMIAAVAMICVAIVAAYLVAREKTQLAAMAVAAGMLIAGVIFIDCRARLGPYLSLADAAQLLNARTREDDTVIFEGTPAACSSLRFYLNGQVSVLDTAADESAAMQKWAGTKPAYLIVHRARVPHWQRRLTERFHIFHQAAACGNYAVLTNQL